MYKTPLIPRRLSAKNRKESYCKKTRALRTRRSNVTITVCCLNRKPKWQRTVLQFHKNVLFSPSDETLCNIHHERKQLAIGKTLFGFVIGVQVGLQQIQALIMMKKNLKRKFQELNRFSLNKCRFYRRPRWSGRLVSFLVFKPIVDVVKKCSIKWKKSRRT